MWLISTTADRCGGSIARNKEDKLDPVWPELEKKEIDMSPSRTHRNNHHFEGIVFLKWASCKKNYL